MVSMVALLAAVSSTVPLGRKWWVAAVSQDEHGPPALVLCAGNRFIERAPSRLPVWAHRRRRRLTRRCERRCGTRLLQFRPVAWWCSHGAVVASGRSGPRYADGVANEHVLRRVHFGLHRMAVSQPRQELAASPIWRRNCGVVVSSMWKSSSSPRMRTAVPTRWLDQGAGCGTGPDSVQAHGR